MKERAANILQADALKSLAKTDNLLIVLNVVMFVGVCATIYGAFWQGRYARASYKKEYEKK